MQQHSDIAAVELMLKLEVRQEEHCNNQVLTAQKRILAVAPPVLATKLATYWTEATQLKETGF